MWCERPNLRMWLKGKISKCQVCNFYVGRFWCLHVNSGDNWTWTWQVRIHRLKNSGCCLNPTCLQQILSVLGEDSGQVLITKIVEEYPLYNFCLGLFSSLLIKFGEKKAAILGFRRGEERGRDTEQTARAYPGGHRRQPSLLWEARNQEGEKERREVG